MLVDGYVPAYRQVRGRRGERFVVSARRSGIASRSHEAKSGNALAGLR